MQLASRAFAPGEEIPRRHTCDGEDRSPPLNWSGVPEGTRSFLVVCNDPDAPSGLFHHWAAYDIPGHWRELPEGLGAESVTGDGIRQAVNDFGRPGYGGPCPPEGGGPHRYYFRVAALGTDTLAVAPSARCEEIVAAASPYVLAQAELVGTYRR